MSLSKRFSTIDAHVHIESVRGVKQTAQIMEAAGFQAAGPLIRVHFLRPKHVLVLDPSARNCRYFRVRYPKFTSPLKLKNNNEQGLIEYCAVERMA